MAPECPVCQYLTKATSHETKRTRPGAEDLYPAAVNQAKPSHYKLPWTSDRTTAGHTFQANLGKAAEVPTGDQPAPGLLPAANPWVLI